MMDERYSGNHQNGIGSSGLPVKQEHDILISVERRLLDCQVEWSDRLSKTTEKLQEATREAKRAFLDLEGEREKTSRLVNEIEELKLEVETIKMTSAAREKYFHKEVDDYRNKLRRKEAELGQIRESTSSDLADLGEKCRKLVASLDEKQQLVASLTDQLKTCRDEKVSFESQLDAERRERERAERLSQDLERRNEDLQSREAQLENKVRQLEEDVADCQAECDRRQKSINELEDAVLAAKRASAEVAMSSGERDRALSHMLEENGKLQAKLEEANVKAAKAGERLRDARQQLSEKEQQLSDMVREVDTQRDYCRTMKLDLDRAHQQREAAFVEHENLAKQLIEFRALPICQQHLSSVSSNDFQSLKLVIPFIREKLDLYDRMVSDLNQAKSDLNALVEQKRDTFKACRDKDAVINECRASLEQALSEIERLRGTVMEADRKQEAATMRAARLTEQLHREQADHEKTLSLLKAAEGEVGAAEQRWTKALNRMLTTMVGQRSGQAMAIQQGMKFGQLIPLVQKEVAALHAALTRSFERINELESELTSSRNFANQREGELRRLKSESDAKLAEMRNLLEHEKSSSLQRTEMFEQRLKGDLTAVEMKLNDVTRDRDELRNQLMRIDSTKLEMETRLSQTLSALDYARNENRLLAAGGGVLLSALVNTLRRVSALIMGCTILRTQVAASEVFRNQLQNLLNSLASTAGLTVEKTAFSANKPCGIFAFRKVVIAVLAANRMAKFTSRHACHQRRTLVLLPAGSCRQIGYTVGMDVLAGNNTACDALAFVCWLGGEDFSKRFIALGSLLALPESSSNLMPGDDRLQSALRSSLRCILTCAVECFDPQLCPSPNRPHASNKRDTLLYALAAGLRHAFARHRTVNRQNVSEHDDSLSSSFAHQDLPIYSFQVIFDSICTYWQRLTDQLVSGWQQQRARLSSDLADTQRQLAIVKPDADTMRRQLEMSVPRAELETACAELSSALDREQKLQVAVNDQAKQLQRLLDENNKFTNQHSASTATIAAKNAEIATIESRLAELIDANGQLQAVAAEAEQVVAKAAADRRWTCDYVKQVESLAVRWAGKLSRLYTDQVEFRQFYGQLHGLGAHVPGGSHGRQSNDGTSKGLATNSNAYHASQACVRLTRTFLHLFDHARKYAQSMADCSAASTIEITSNYGVDELASMLTSKAPSAASFASFNNSKRSPRSKKQHRNNHQSSTGGTKSVQSTPRDIMFDAHIMN